LVIFISQLSDFLSAFLVSKYSRLYPLCGVLELSPDNDSPFGMEAIRKEDFPILFRDVHSSKPLIYLDSAASSHKPKYVLNKMDEYYLTSHSNVHRGAHALANKATTLYECARTSVQAFINAKHREEIVFTRGATDAINIVAQGFSLPGPFQLQPGDEIILSVAEHHSNLVPWQMTASKTGAVLKFVQLTQDMQLDMDHYRSLLSSRTKIVALSHASNVLGVVQPVRDIIQAAHSVGARVLLDSCQAVPHMAVDVQQLEVDFLVASSHKMCGPTGIGFLYGRLELLNSLPPSAGGGEMIDTVELYSSTYASSPSRFEAGTPPIAEAVGLGAACEYLSAIGMDKVEQHDAQLGRYLYEQLREVGGLELYGPDPRTDGVSRTGLVAFNAKSVHSADLSFFLDQEGVAVRTGHHCTQPLHKILGVPGGSVRASLYFYNDKSDVDKFIEKLKDTLYMFETM